jgi:hypothetical protein
MDIPLFRIRVFVVASVFLLPPLFAQSGSVKGANSGRLTLQDLVSAEFIGETALSPDGTMFALSRNGQISLMPASGGWPEPLTSTTGGKSGLAWSPDGQRLAFVSQGGIWTVSVSGGAPRADLNNGPEEERLINQAIDYLTKATGKRPVGTRAGGWVLSPYSLDIYKRAGLLYDSSMMARDEPYDIMMNGKDSGLLELPVSWIEDDAPYFGRTGALPSPEMIFKVYQDEFDMAYREGTFLILTFHPHISGRRSRVGHMEKLFDYMKSKPGVWFATAEEVAEYIKKHPSAAVPSE